MTIISKRADFPLASISIDRLRWRTNNDPRHDRAILDFLQLFELGLCPGEVSTERLQALWRTEQYGVSRRMAAIRALVQKTLPAEEPSRGGMRPGGTQPVTSDEFKQIQRQRTRANQLALAAELDGEAPQPNSRALK